MTARPAIPRLLFVTDARRAKPPLIEVIAAAAAGGVDGVYLRDVALSPTELGSLVAEIRARGGPALTVLVNGGPGVALVAGAGLHLRERDMGASAARSALGEAALIGRAVHDTAGARAAAGADYLLAGHVYPSASKPGQPPLGLAGLAAIVAAAPCPVLAIGGITPERVAAVIATGAAGIAVIGAIAEADDPRRAASNLRAALDRALCESKRSKESSMSESTAAATAIDLTINGKTVTLPQGTTIHDFLASKRMTDAMAIVERNGEIVSRAAYATVILQPDDELEIVHAVGGG
ncbi:MAG: sulfur carrier protein ThiS [Thermomicrobiales bacterium]